MNNMYGRKALCCNSCLQIMVVSCILMHERVNKMLQLWKGVSVLSCMEVLLTPLFDSVVLFGLSSNYLAKNLKYNMLHYNYMIDVSLYYTNRSPVNIPQKSASTYNQCIYKFPLDESCTLN